MPHVTANWPFSSVVGTSPRSVRGCHVRYDEALLGGASGGSGGSGGSSGGGGAGGAGGEGGGGLMRMSCIDSHVGTKTCACAQSVVFSQRSLHATSSGSVCVVASYCTVLAAST